MNENNIRDFEKTLEGGDVAFYLRYTRTPVRPSTVAQANAPGFPIKS
jgi:hypothetical protein